MGSGQIATVRALLAVWLLSTIVLPCNEDIKKATQKVVPHLYHTLKETYIIFLPAALRRREEVGASVRFTCLATAEVSYTCSFTLRLHNRALNLEGDAVNFLDPARRNLTCHP